MKCILSGLTFNPQEFMLALVSQSVYNWRVSVITDHIVIILGFKSHES